MARTASKASKASKTAKPKVTKAPKEKVIKARDPLKYNAQPAQNHFFHGQVFVVVSDETRKKYAEATGTQSSTNRNNPNYRQGAEFANRLQNPLYENEVLVLIIDRNATVINPDDGSIRNRVMLNITGDINDVIASITNFMVYMKKHAAVDNSKSDDELYAETRGTVYELLRDPKITITKTYLESNDPEIKASQANILAEYKQNAEAYKARNNFPYDIEMLNSIRISNKSSAELSKRDKKPKNKPAATTTTEPKKRGPMPLLVKIKKQLTQGKNGSFSLVKFGVAGAAGRPKSLTWVQADKAVSHPKLTVDGINWIVSQDSDLQAFVDQLVAENPEGSENYAVSIQLIHSLNNAWTEYKRAHQVAIPSQSVVPPPATAVVSPLVAVATAQTTTPNSPSYLSVTNLLSTPAPAPTPTPSPVSTKIGLSTAATPVSVSSENSLSNFGFFDRGGAIPGFSSVPQPTVKAAVTPMIQVAPTPLPTPVVAAPTPLPTPVIATPAVQPVVQQPGVQQAVLEHKEGLANALPATTFNPATFSIGNFFAANVATPGK